MDGLKTNEYVLAGVAVRVHSRMNPLWGVTARFVGVALVIPVVGLVATVYALAAKIGLPASSQYEVPSSAVHGRPKSVWSIRAFSKSARIVVFRVAANVTAP